jgi:hypothetical protein
MKPCCGLNIPFDWESVKFYHSNMGRLRYNDMDGHREEGSSEAPLASKHPLLVKDLTLLLSEVDVGATVKELGDR